MAGKESTAVAEIETKSNLPSFMQERAKGLGGMGNSTASSDNSLPFLAIIQKGSPQLNKQKAEFIKGAEVGDLFNTATGRLFKVNDEEIYPSGLPVIPFEFQKAYVEWIPRDAGGGYVGTHQFSERVLQDKKAVKQKKGPPMTPEGTQLVETAYQFVLIEDSPMPLVMGMSSTQLGPMRGWMSMRNEFTIDGEQAPSFTRRYGITTVYKENDQGDWYQFKIVDLGWLEDERLFNRALGFAEAAAKGEITVGRPDDIDGASVDSDDGIPL